MLAGLRATNDEPTTEEFFVMQFLHSAFCLLDGLHLDEGKTFRALIMPVTYDLSVLHVPNAVEQFEEIALGGEKSLVNKIKRRRSHFDCLRFTLKSGRMRTVGRIFFWFFVASVSKKCCHP